MGNDKILEVKNLCTSFFTHVGEVQAVRNLNFHVNKGEMLGIVGESGSGKSVSCLSIMRLLTENGKVKEGEVLFNGNNILDLNEKEMAQIRGDKISMIFQDPMTAINPVFTIGHQMVDIIRTHKGISQVEAKALAIDMLDKVGIPAPASRIKNYPHEFSGGMRQRAMIAMSLSCSPELVIADEPTTALDVTIQAQVLDLITSIQKEMGTAVILITHDLGVIAETCKRVVVMYGGMKMEEALVEDLFKKPQNPYTIGLLQSVPNPESNMKERLVPIPGTPPDLVAPPKGCPFEPRCSYRMKICTEKQAPFFKLNDSHGSRCWLLHPESPVEAGFEKAVSIGE